MTQFSQQIKVLRRIRPVSQSNVGLGDCGPAQPEAWDHSAKAMLKPFETELKEVVGMPSATI